MDAAGVEEATAEAAGDPDDRTRRDVFAVAAGAAAAALAGVVLTADPAGATQGAAAVCGLNNSETAVTTFTNLASNGNGVAGVGFGTGTGVVGTGGGTSGTGVTATGGGPDGVGLVAEGKGGGRGIIATGGDAGGAGVLANGGPDSGFGIVAEGSGNGHSVFAQVVFDGTANAVFANVLAGNCSGSAVRAKTVGTGPAGKFESNTAQLLLAPITAGRAAPIGDAVAHAAGELLRDGSGDLWYCAIAGTPGTWRRLAGGGTAGAFNVLPAPVRVYDSRPGTSPNIGSKTPLTANVARTLDATVNSSGVPAGATAVTVNLLLVNAVAGNGNFTIWANGIAKPAANNMVWGGSAGRFSSVAITALDATGKCQVSSSLKTDFVLDVVGFYR